MAAPNRRPGQSRIREALMYFGLAHPGGEDAPLPGAPRTSRYGIRTSPRLDQDIDALQKRIEELEARLSR